MKTMIDRRYFCERREAERRENVTAAIAFHFQECERRKAERRAADNAAVCAWLSIFHKNQDSLTGRG